MQLSTLRIFVYASRQSAAASARLLRAERHSCGLCRELGELREKLDGGAATSDSDEEHDAPVLRRLFLARPRPCPC